MSFVLQSPPQECLLRSDGTNRSCLLLLGRMSGDENGNMGAAAPRGFNTITGVP